MGSNLCSPSATLTVDHGSFSSCVGQFVLTASLRSQVNPTNSEEFKEVSPERYVIPAILGVTLNLTANNRAFADFALGSIVLHFFVYNFLG
jgi:oligosaccharyltransferase complex subunit epsilon